MDTKNSRMDTMVENMTRGDAIALKEALERYIAQMPVGQGAVAFEEQARTVSKEAFFKKVTKDILCEMGIPQNIIGYRYWLFGLIEAAKNPMIIDGITKEFYPLVAKKFATTGSRVERAMRHAVERMCDNGNMDALAKVFGNTISADKGKPTNSEFAFTLVNYIRDLYEEACE